MSRRTNPARILLLLALAVGCATADFPQELAPKPSARFSPAQDPYYGPPLPALQALLLLGGKNQATNHFCVVGYKWPDGNAAVWVLWREEQRLMLWRDNSDPELRAQGLVHAQRDLKLGKDTVANEAEIRGSTYLVTRAWWESVAKDCDSHGERLTVPSFPNP
jgi:hypothetical protein